MAPSHEPNVIIYISRHRGNCGQLSTSTVQISTSHSMQQSVTKFILLLHPFNGFFSRTTWLSQYQKCKTSLHLNEARDDRVLGCSGISWSEVKTCISTQLMPLPLPLTVSCFSKIQIGFTFLVPAHPGGPGKMAVKQVCVWNQLDHMQTICTSLQTDNHTSSSSLYFYRPDALPDTQPTVSKH